MRFRSTKKVKDFSKITRPFTVKFPETIEGGVNGKMFRFLGSKRIKLDFSQYEALFNSSYAKYLKG